MPAPAQQCLTCGALLSGAILSGRFRIETLLGRGGMGAVYRASDLALGRAVAVKVLAPSPGQAGEAPQELRKRFFREARLAAQLDHPNIVPVLHFDIDGPLAYLVMPLLTGGTLAHRLSQRRPVDPIIALGWMRQIAAALDYAHQRPQPIVHRDVKPSNLLFHDDGRLCLADFGIARVVAGTSTQETTQLTRAGIVLGSLTYMAPEQISGHAVPASDQYSTGVLLYELLTGVLPFESTDNYALMMQHLSVPPTPPSQLIPSLSPAMDAVVLRALAKQPEDRFPTVGALVVALEAALANANTAQVQAPAAPHLTTPIAPRATAALPNGDPRGELPTQAATRLQITTGWPPTPGPRPAPQRPIPPAPNSHRNRWIVAISPVLVALLICAVALAGLNILSRANRNHAAAPTHSAASTPRTPQPTVNPYVQTLLAAESHNPLFKDPLSNNLHLWVLQNGARFQRSALYLPGFQESDHKGKGGGDGEGAYAWRLLDLSSSFAVEVEVTFSGTNAAYGFGFTSIGSPGYIIALSDGGFYSILQVQGSDDHSPTTLSSGTDPRLKLTRGQPARLALLVQGNQVAFFLNRQFAAAVTLSDASFDTSHIFALGNLSSKDLPSGDVYFKNLVIYPA